MASDRLTKCVEHGGFFQHPVQRGRRRTTCKPEFPCSRSNEVAANRQRAADSIEVLKDSAGKVTGLQGPSRVERTASEIKNRRAEIRAKREGDNFDRMTTSELREYARGRYSSISRLRRREDILTALRKQEAKEAAWEANRQTAEPTPSAAANYLTEEAANATAQRAIEAANRPSELAPEALKAPNPCQTMALAAKERLEPLGWLVKGRGWREGADTYAEVTAVRGTETLIIQFKNGMCTGQNYSLWDMEKPSKNGKPASRLNVNTDEMTDRELIRVLAGSKVTWWNNLGSKEETAIVSKDKIEITHAYTGIGDETPADRIVKFADHSGAGFRAFRMGALISIG